MRSPSYGFKATGVYLELSFIKTFSDCLVQYDIQNVVLLYVFFYKTGEGGVMNLVYGSSFSSYMACFVFLQ